MDEDDSCNDAYNIAVVPCPTCWVLADLLPPRPYSALEATTCSVPIIPAWAIW